jgi:para-aminobenzoate synthetase/4-amino-4-deoxychorismate lyase
MQILAELEDSPRGIYTGAIGFVSPGPECRFSVAIRTVWIDALAGVAEYGVGGGITWDSTPEGEYEECAVKARLLHSARPEFELLETLLWEPGNGYLLLDRHLERLRRSAHYFGFALDAPNARRLLQARAAAFGPDRYRVRLLLDRSGDARLEARPLEVAREPLRAGLCREPVDRCDPMLFHKTTWRQPYDRRRSSHPDCDEVILLNERGEVTECATGNLGVRLDGQLWTPPLACGLLPGVYRAELLATGGLRERVLTAADLRRADELYLINSVRRQVRLVLAD